MFLSTATEWQGKEVEPQAITIAVVTPTCSLNVDNYDGRPTRVIDLKKQNCVKVWMANDKQRETLLFTVSREYDLVRYAEGMTRELG